MDYEKIKLFIEREIEVNMAHEALDKMHAAFRAAGLCSDETNELTDKLRSFAQSPVLSHQDAERLMNLFELHKWGLQLQPIFEAHGEGGTFLWSAEMANIEERIKAIIPAGHY